MPIGRGTLNQPSHMKSYLFAIALMALASTSADAGNVLVTNFDETSVRQRPISTWWSTPILSGGVVQIGSFTSADPGALIAGLCTLAGLAALLNDFIPFGSSASIGADFSGLYASDQSSPITSDSPLIGKNIYTLIGNNATLATSTNLGIVRHPGTFAADNPVFEGVADISDPGATILFGRLGPGVTTALGMGSPSIMLVDIVCPEPSSAMLLLLGLVGLRARRRRA